MQGGIDKDTIFMFEAYLDFCTHEYWSRPWTVPEVIKGRVLVLSYGQQLVVWTDLINFKNCLDGLGATEDTDRYFASSLHWSQPAISLE